MISVIPNAPIFRYPISMKPTIPETGTVIKLDGEMALVMLQGGEACKGCGAGKLGLCKPSGNISMLRVKNTAGACMGDTVRVGLARETQVKGLLFAFVIPFAGFIGGTFAGCTLREVFQLPFLEVISAFMSFFLVSWYSLTRLKKMDSAPEMTIQEVVSDSVFTEERKTLEERRFEHHTARF